MSGFLLDSYPSGATVYALFHTFNSSGASVTITGLATTDIEIYKNGSTTQRASDNGYALLDTDGTDFDGLTGIHGFSVDLSDNSDASFYTIGAQFTVVVSAITADSQTVSFVVGTFRIAAAETSSGTPKVDVSHFGGTAGTFSSGRPEVNTSHIAGSAVSTSTAQIGVNVVNAAGTAWNSGAIGASTLATDTITAAKIAADAIGASEIADGAIDAGAIATGAITSAKFAAGAIDAAAIATDAITNAKIAADAIGAAEIADGAIDANTFAAGAITAAAIASDAITSAELAISAVDEIVDAVWDELTSGHTTAGTFGQALFITRANTAQAGSTASTIVLDASASATDDIYNDHVITITAGTGAVQARVISDYVGSTKTATVTPDWDVTPSNTSVFMITPMFPASASGGGATAAEIADAVWDEATSGHTTSGTFGEQLKTDVDAILDDTGTSGVVVASIAANAITATAIASNAITSAKIATDAIDADALASDAVTEIQSGLATSASISALNNISAAQVNAQVVDALATDTYAEPGQGNPSATTTIAEKIGYLYKAWRNKTDQTATTYSLYADNTTTVDQKATVSDDGVTTTRTEVATGP